MVFMEQIEAYIESKKYAWSPTTLKSERARLMAISYMLSFPPHHFYEQLVSQDYKPYTIKTTMQRVAEYKAFTGDSSFKTFIKDHARLFRNSYTKVKVPMTFEVAAHKLAGLQNEVIRNIASLMLQTGMRVHEALKYDGSGRVVGKGGKLRPVYTSRAYSNPGRSCTYQHVYRALQNVGLKPHDLRKLAATRLAESGFKEADLMEVMGWNSIQTASSYLQPTSEALLKERVQGVLVV